ncbi:hydrolase [Erysipelothrix rhusiopathiae]|uniref:hydrolase n=1 Tax=Erysipelothrix rhusiopathiae TaxID=1648 RepID=UPI002B2533B6|nr:hydrolase [Erysipelothrix rhusiopathiae]WRB93156.1 hydrolase [Erysipelothrix rhusiopathiae]
MFVPEYNGNLRSHIIRVPESIQEASGIKLFGRTIKSFLFTTDVAIIRNCNADAVIAIYPFTPQPIITHAIKNVADVPVFSGIGGGTTRGLRVVGLAVDAEQQGATGVVLNAPTTNKLIRLVKQAIEIPIIITVLNENEDIQARLDAGATILNVSAAARTPEVVAAIRKNHPQVPIIATGGPTEESCRKTIKPGANAVSFTPPSTADMFKDLMATYRE